VKREFYIVIGPEGHAMCSTTKLGTARRLLESYERANNGAELFKLLRVREIEEVKE